MGGHRSILDNSVQFTDFAPIEIDDQRRQKIRRAQGLQHLLMSINTSDDRIKRSNYSYIINLQKYFHLIIPVLLMAIALNSVIRWSTSVSPVCLKTSLLMFTHSFLLLRSLCWFLG